MLVFIGDMELENLTIVANPKPSASDPAGSIGTVMTSFLIVSEGQSGCHVIKSVARTVQLSDRADNEEKLKSAYSLHIESENEKVYESRGRYSAMQQRQTGTDCA